MTDSDFIHTLEARLLGRIAALEQEQEQVSGALLALYSEAGGGMSGFPRRKFVVAEGTVMELLRAHPGMTTAQLVTATRFSTPKVNSLMRRLESDRKVHRRGRPIGWYAIAPKVSR